MWSLEPKIRLHGPNSFAYMKQRAFGSHDRTFFLGLRITLTNLSLYNLSKKNGARDRDKFRLHKSLFRSQHVSMTNWVIAPTGHHCLVLAWNWRRTFSGMSHFTLTIPKKAVSTLQLDRFEWKESNRISAWTSDEVHSSVIEGSRRTANRLAVRFDVKLAAGIWYFYRPHKELGKIRTQIHH